MLELPLDSWLPLPTRIRCILDSLSACTYTESGWTVVVRAATTGGRQSWPRHPIRSMGASIQSGNRISPNRGGACARVMNVTVAALIPAAFPGLHTPRRPRTHIQRGTTLQSPGPTRDQTCADGTVDKLPLSQRTARRQLAPG